MRSATTTANGTTLTIDVPDGLEASQIPDGLILRPPNAAARRQVYEIAITLLTADGKGESKPLDGVRGGGADAIRYRVDRFDGGSGGEEVTLIATRACGGATARMRFNTQGEDGVDLEPAFAVLESARCAPAG